jgi:hypothetical protein
MCKLVSYDLSGSLISNSGTCTARATIRSRRIGMGLDDRAIELAFCTMPHEKVAEFWPKSGWLVALKLQLANWRLLQYAIQKSSRRVLHSLMMIRFGNEC